MANITLTLHHSQSNTSYTKEQVLSDANLLRVIAYFKEKYARYEDSGDPLNPNKILPTNQEVADGIFGELISKLRNETITYERNQEIANISIPNIS